MPDDARRKRMLDGDRVAPRGPALIAVLIGLALVLAIGFFYLTEVRKDHQADQVTNAAGQLDGAADRLGDAARDAANRFDSN